MYTIVLGIVSIASSFFDRRGYLGHACARAWSWLILAFEVRLIAEPDVIFQRQAPHAAADIPVGRHHEADHAVTVDQIGVDSEPRQLDPIATDGGV